MKPSIGRHSGRENQPPSRSPTLPNVIVHKAKHIIPVRDAIKYTLYNSSGQASPNNKTNNAADTSFGSTSSPPKHSPPPPPITPSIRSNQAISAHSNPLYQSLTSQLNYHNSQSISLNRLMSHPYFRSHYLLNNSLRKSGNEKKSTLSNSFTNSNSQPDQVQDHSTNSTLKSYLSDRNVSNSNPTPQTNPNSISPNKSRTLPIQHSSRRSRRSQRSANGTTSSKRLTEEQLRHKLAQYEMYIASQLDKVDNVEKKNAQDKKPKLSDEQWQQLIFQRIFLGANSILLLCAFVMLALACILDPNPIHKLDSKGGFYAFNSVVLIFLSLLGLYGMRPLRKKLLLAYASSIAFLLLFRLITGLVMLIALENNQFELIFLLSAGLIEMMLAILALAIAYNEPLIEFNKPNIVSIDGQAPIQVLCKDDNKKDKNKNDNNNSFSKNSTLRRSMNANHAPRPTIQEQQKQQQAQSSPSLVTGIQTTTGELLYLSPENLIFNERSVDTPSEAKKLEQRNYNYTTNITQYSTIAELANKKGDKKPTSTRSSLAKQSKDEIITKTTLVAKPFQLNKDLLNKTSKPPISTKESSAPSRSTSTLNRKSNATTPSKPTDTVDRKVENNYQTMNRPTHKRQQSSSFLTNTNLPYRTSTPSNQMPSSVLPSIQQIGSSSYSPQNTTSSIGTSKASIFDYNYSPLNLNQISHHIISSQKPTSSKETVEPINRLSSLNRSLPSLAATKQNILMNKMNFLNNNTYDANQYKQNIINSIVNDEPESRAREASSSRSQNKWPRY